jgi:hypothetical protein
MFYRILITSTVCAAIFFGLSGQSRSLEADRRLEHVIEEKVKPLLRHPAVINAVKLQNQRNSKLKQEEILALDAEYLSYRLKGKKTTFVAEILDSELSRKLQKIKRENDGVFTEIFVMDNRGLNVAQSDVTSDFWQGDENKWQRTYLLGPHALYISQIDYDESTGKHQLQVSATVSEHGLPIGAVTFGVDLSQLH